MTIEGEKRIFRVGGSMTISMYVDVEASNVEEAKQLAEAAPVMSLCHQCADGDGLGTWNTSGELDGEPDIRENDEVIDMGPAKRRGHRG